MYREPWESRWLPHRSIKWLLQCEKIHNPLSTNTTRLYFFQFRKQSEGGHLPCVWGGACSETCPWGLREPLCGGLILPHLTVEELLDKPLRYPQLGRPCRLQEGEGCFLSPYKVSGSVPVLFTVSCFKGIFRLSREWTCPTTPYGIQETILSWKDAYRFS